MNEVFTGKKSTKPSLLLVLSPQKIPMFMWLAGNLILNFFVPLPQISPKIVCHLKSKEADLLKPLFTHYIRHKLAITKMFFLQACCSRFLLFQIL